MFLFVMSGKDNRHMKAISDAHILLSINNHKDYCFFSAALKLSRGTDVLFEQK